ncbi:hypothetical protein ACIO6T_30690 [Streptomyces sp. NPDC087532]|uniref:hypothetical protein n=1 Tax=Streptomyces sp. NPDC087532 TaxID=3365795 RepID=UPI003825C008
MSSLLVRLLADVFVDGVQHDGNSRYASGVPLVDDDGTLLSVSDPLPTHSTACVFLRDVGACLIFPAEERRARFVSRLRQNPPLPEYWMAVA